MFADRGIGPHGRMNQALQRAVISEKLLMKRNLQLRELAILFRKQCQSLWSKSKYSRFPRRFKCKIKIAMFKSLEVSLDSNLNNYLPKANVESSIKNGKIIIF